jgi:uncharacterized protein YndB with AHSA1/START domain
MSSTNKTAITIEAIINAPVEKVWECWTGPQHIVHWNNASDDWHTPHAESNLRVGGKFLTRMESRDGTSGFDFEGVFTSIITNKYIEYALGDDRIVRITFTGTGNQTRVVEVFDAEEVNTVELQKMGWQSILNNFKNYTEKNN